MGATVQVILAVISALPNVIAEVETDIEKIKADPTTQAKIRDIADAAGQLLVSLAKVL